MHASETITIYLDGAPQRVREGANLAVILLEARTPSRRSVTGTVRAPFCGMGFCGECRVKVDGIPQLACRTACSQDIKVTTSD